MVFITFGVTKTLAGQLDTACRIIDTDTEASAIEIAESLGNVAGTTACYTDEALIALACERPDYIEDLNCSTDCASRVPFGECTCGAAARRNAEEAR